MNSLRTSFSTLLGLGIALSAVAQAPAGLDSVFTNEGILAVTVKEITTDGVKYTYPGEDVINTVYKNAVQRIRFRSGRTQSFAESSSFALVTGGDDWERVTLTQVESEVKGLYKLEEVTAKAVGTTVLANVNKVKNRALDKLRMQAALVGANVVYMINQTTTGNQYGGYFQSGKSAETNLTGIAYSNRRPTLADLNAATGQNRDFYLVATQSLGNNSTDIETTPQNRVVHVDNFEEDNGSIYVTTGPVEGTDLRRYRLTYCDDKKIVLMARDRRRVYNLILSNLAPR